MVTETNLQFRNVFTAGEFWLDDFSAHEKAYLMYSMLREDHFLGKYKLFEGIWNNHAPKAVHLDSSQCQETATDKEKTPSSPVAPAGRVTGHCESVEKIKKVWNYWKQVVGCTITLDSEVYVCLLSFASTDYSVFY